MNYVISLINEKIKNSACLTSSDFNSIVECLSHYYHLSDYLKGIVLEHNTLNKECLAKSQCNTGEIIFYIDNMRDYNSVLYVEYLKKYPYISYPHFDVLFNLITIIHELKHLLQDKTIDNALLGKSNDVLVRILMDCKALKREIYNDYYYINPNERDAEVFAYATSINIARNCPNINADILRTICLMYYDLLLSSYGKHTRRCLLKEFYSEALLKTNIYKDYLLKLHELNTFQKISFNFPILNHELSMIREGYHLLENDYNPYNVIVNNKVLFKTRSTL